MRSYFITYYMEKSLADKGNERKMREKTEKRSKRKKALKEKIGRG